MPRILHVIDTTGPGGAETVFLQVASAVRGGGWYSLATIPGPGWVEDALIRLKIAYTLVPSQGKFNWRYLRDLRRLIVRERVDLVHAHLLSPVLYSALATALTGIAVVGTFHGMSDLDPITAQRRAKYGLIRARRVRVVCVSRSLAKRAVARGFDPETVKVIHNGVAIPEFERGNRAAVRQAMGISDDDILVGTIGNIRPAKDYANFMRAAAIMADEPRFRFAIIGHAAEPLYSELLLLRDELNLTNRLAFWGFREDIADVLSAFDVAAVSSLSEGFSLATVQAMAAGRPVVATRSGGPEEIIDDGVTGLLVPVSDPAALAAGIRKVALNPTLRQEVATRAMSAARRRFSLDAMVAEYQAVYEAALGLE